MQGTHLAVTLKDVYRVIPMHFILSVISVLTQLVC